MRETAELMFSVLIIMSKSVIGVVVGVLMLYVAVRITSAAWHRSKYEVLNKKDKTNGGF